MWLLKSNDDMISQPSSGDTSPPQSVRQRVPRVKLVRRPAETSCATFHSPLGHVIYPTPGLREGLNSMRISIDIDDIKQQEQQLILRPDTCCRQSQWHQPYSRPCCSAACGASLHHPPSSAPVQ